MLVDSIDAKTIARLVGVSPEEVEKIAKSLKD